MRRLKHNANSPHPIHLVRIAQPLAAQVRTWPDAMGDDSARRRPNRDAAAKESFRYLEVRKSICGTVCQGKRGLST